MKRLLRKFEAAFVAVAFAEEGEADAARRIMAETGTDQTAAPREDGAGSRSRSSPRAALARGSRA